MANLKHSLTHLERKMARGYTQADLQRFMAIFAKLIYLSDDYLLLTGVDSPPKIQPELSPNGPRVEVSLEEISEFERLSKPVTGEVIRVEGVEKGGEV